MQPDLAWGHYNLGCILDQEGKRGQAVECYGAALRQDPGFALAHLNRGLALVDLKRFQPALDEVPNYIELIEGDPPSLAIAANVAELDGEERMHDWETEDGALIEARTIVGPGDGPLPWFPVRQENPDAFMEPEWIVHPNGALGLTAINAVADDPKATADALAKA